MYCAIIDDDLAFSQRLQDKLEYYFKDYFNDFHIDIISQDFTQQQYNHYNLVFLDIDLKTYNGIQLAKTIHSSQMHTHIIFVSSLNECVFDALSTNPLFFIRKSHLEKDFLVLTHILNDIFKNQFKHFEIKINGRQISIYHHDIQYISVAGHDVTINTGHQYYTFRGSLNEVLNMIQAPNIIQISKTAAINLQNVISISNQQCLLKNNVKINIGRVYKDKVFKQYQEWLLR